MLTENSILNDPVDFAHETEINKGREEHYYLPMEWSGPVDFVYARKAARRKIDERSSALPTTPVT